MYISESQDGEVESELHDSTMKSSIVYSSTTVIHVNGILQPNAIKL
jgi:hypothetical protein